MQKDLPKALHLYNSVAEGSKYPRAFTKMYAVAILSLVFEVSVSGSVKRDHLIQLIKENEAKKPTAIHDAIAKNPFEPITKPPKLPRTRTQRKDSPSSSSSLSPPPPPPPQKLQMMNTTLCTMMNQTLHLHLFHQRATAILNCHNCCCCKIDVGVSLSLVTASHWQI